MNVSTSRQKSSSGLTSGTGRQYVKAFPIHVVGLPDPYRLPYVSARFI